MADYKIDKDFLQRSKELKIDIDDEWYNGELNIFTIKSFNNNPIFGGLEEIFTQLIEAGTNEVELFLEPVGEGKIPIKWETAGSKKGEPGTSFWKRATQAGEFTFNVIGDVDFTKQVTIFSLYDTVSDPNDPEKDFTQYFVVETVDKTYHPDGSVITSKVHCISASQVLTDDDIQAKWYFTTISTQPKNVKTIKIEFNQNVVFNGIEIESEGVNLIPSYIDNVKANEWKFLPVYPAADLTKNRLWKTEAPYEYAYIFNAYRSGYSEYKGAGLSGKISTNCNSTTQAEGVIQSYYNGNAGQTDFNGNGTHPNRLFGGSNTNGYASIFMDWKWDGNEQYKMAKIFDGANGGGLAAGHKVTVWSNYFTRASASLGETNNPLIGRLSWISSGECSRDPIDLDINIIDGSPFYVPTSLFVKRVELSTDECYVIAGGILENSWYITEDFYTKFVKRQFGLSGDAGFQVFNQVQDKVDKGLLKDYGVDDYVYYSLIPAPNTKMGNRVRHNFNQNFIEAFRDDRVEPYGWTSGNKNTLYGITWNTPDTDYARDPSTLPDQQSSIPQSWFQKKDLQDNSITITLTEEREEINSFGIYAYGNSTATVKVSYYNETGDLQTSYTTPLSSSVIANRLFTGKVWS